MQGKEGNKQSIDNKMRRVFEALPTAALTHGIAGVKDAARRAAAILEGKEDAQ